MKIRTYSELKKLKTFEERYKYLKLVGSVGETIFGSERYLNQDFYRSKTWKNIRSEVILRDEGCDLAIPGREIYDKIIVHHMNPLTLEEIKHGDFERAMDPEFLICVTLDTHNAIHYGDESLLIKIPEGRKAGDTTLW